MTIAKRTSNTKNRLSGDAVRIGDDVKQLALDTNQVVSEKVKGWTDGLRGQVAEAPIRAVLIAAGVGVFVGLFFRFGR